MDELRDGTPGQPPGGRLQNSYFATPIPWHLSENVSVFSGLPGHAGISCKVVLMASLIYEGVRQMRGGSEWWDMT